MPNGMPPPPPPMPRSSRTLSLRRKSFQRMVGSFGLSYGQLIGMLGRLETRLEWDSKSQHRESFAMQLVEQYAGIGSLRWRNGTLGPIPYQIARYQGMATSGLPVP